MRRDQRCELQTDRSKRAAADATVAAVKGDLPAGLAAPALRALIGAGIKNLKDLSQFNEAELLQLHGMGPKAMSIIRDALAAQRQPSARRKSTRRAKRETQTP